MILTEGPVGSRPWLVWAVVDTARRVAAARRFRLLMRYYTEKLSKPAFMPPRLLHSDKPTRFDVLIRPVFAPVAES